MGLGPRPPPPPPVEGAPGWCLGRCGGGDCLPGAPGEGGGILRVPFREGGGGGTPIT